MELLTLELPLLVALGWHRLDNRGPPFHSESVQLG